MEAATIHFPMGRGDGSQAAIITLHTKDITMMPEGTTADTMAVAADTAAM